MPVKIEGKSYYPIPAAAAVLEMSQEAVYNYIQSGHIKTAHIWKQVLIAENHLNEFKTSAVYSRSPMQRFRRCFKNSKTA